MSASVSGALFLEATMPYVIRNGLTCCEVDGHIAILDFPADRYFRLFDSDEAIFRRFLSSEDLTAEETRRLVRKKILTENSREERSPASPLIGPLSQSAVEQSAAAQVRSISVTVALEVTMITWSIQRKLRSRSLATVVEEVASIMHKAVRAKKLAAAQHADDTCFTAADEFTRARRYVPIKPSCLLDSLALSRFLSRRGLPASIVFGVTLEPFAAHCWLQAGETVLNDTLSNAQAHTPIKVIR